MTLNYLLTKCKEIAEEHEDVKYSNVSDKWSISAQEEKYMAVWFETPVFVSYIRNVTKQYTLAMSVLQLCDDYDDYDDVLQQTSDAEAVGDDIIHALIDRLKGEKVMIGIESVKAVTLRNFTSADLVGVRYDITYNVQSNSCSYPLKMNTP
jgi:hypothetical protein